MIRRATTTRTVLISKFAASAFSCLLSCCCQRTQRNMTKSNDTMTTVDGSVSQEQLESFQRDGYLVVRGLFDERELQGVIEKGQDLSTVQAGLYFSTMFKGAMYSHEAFRAMAVHSKMPKIAAELMQLDAGSQNIRVLRYVSMKESLVEL
jgi:hypothetical protein